MAWLTLHNHEEAAKILNAQGDTAPMAEPDAAQALQEFLISRYEWRHAEPPDEEDGDAPDA